ncbi:MAG TPA: hypothetical protein VE944_21770 [Nostoc sp.]|nr:hypothetical protein [Nostoc sp.]HYX16930.1 hypothetical protein [Nostoc sp.]
MSLVFVFEEEPTTKNTKEKAKETSGHALAKTKDIDPEVWKSNFLSKII